MRATTRIAIAAIALSACAMASAAGLQPRFAEQLAPEVGEWVVLRLTVDAAGVVETCRLQSVRESLPDGTVLPLTPSDRYVAEACRKLAQRKWDTTRAADGRLQPLHYYCRHVESTPDTAYCERRFGE